jgi:5-methylcytosine-specific restriction endonuclease McrA
LIQVGVLVRIFRVSTSGVLVLNRSYLPVHVTSVRRAFSMLYQGVARVVDEQYETFDFDSWRDLAVRAQDDSIGIVGGLIRVPRVILLTAFDRIPRRHVRFSRINVYARDRSTCQYCGRRFPRTELNLDHVVPRSKGGRTTWENVVCSCTDCNRRKGGRTPQQAGMRLIAPPRRPRWTPMAGVLAGHRGYPEWRPFLSIVDASYWHAELAE